VTVESQARASAEIYHQLLDAISAGLNANVSAKLTQMGMDFDPELAERIMGRLLPMRLRRTVSFVSTWRAVS